MALRHRSVLLVPAALFLVLAVVACEDDATSSTPGGSLDASTSYPDTGVGSIDSGAPGEDAPSGACTTPVNGALKEKGGTFNHQVTNVIDLKFITTLVGTIDCEGQFDAAGGVQGPTPSGAFNFQCWGTKDDRYYGIRVTGFGKPKPSDTFKAGHASSIADGSGGYKPNGEFDIAWEEGPRCDSKQDKSAEWIGGTGTANPGELLIDTVTGDVIEFHLSPTAMKPGSGGLNYTGKGTFSLAGSGKLKLAGL